MEEFKQKILKAYTVGLLTLQEYRVLLGLVGKDDIGAVKGFNKLMRKRRKGKR